MVGNDNKELIENLKERLRWYYGEATEEEFDADAVDAICTLLDKLEPVEEEQEDMEAVYESLMTRIRAEEAEKANAENLLIGNEEALDKLKAWIQEESAEEDLEEELSETDDAADRAFGEKRELAPDKDVENESSDKKEKRISDRENEEIDSEEKGKMRPFRKTKKEKNGKTRAGIRVAAVLIIGVLGAGILAVNNQMQASANKSLLTMILEEVGVVKIRKMRDTKEEDWSDDRSETYNSWSDLDEEIKSKIVVPGYIPAGFSFYNLKCQELENRTVVWADYYDNTGGHLIFDISLNKSEVNAYSERVMEENECKLLPKYSNEDTLYYYAEEKEEYICMVSGEYCYYKIIGNIELDEMMKVREGIRDIN